MHFYRNKAQRLALGIFLIAVALISLSHLNLGLSLWMMFILVSLIYCTVQCAQRYSGLTYGNKMLILLIILALAWKIFRLQGANSAPISSDLTSAVNADVYLFWTYLSPIFSAFLLGLIILSPESQLTISQIRDRRTLNQLWWQQQVSRTSKAVFYTTVLSLVLMAAWTVVDHFSENAWSVYLTSNVLILLPDLLLHLLGLLFYAELLAGKDTALKAAAGSA